METKEQSNRRAVLKVAGSLAALSLAGCTGDDTGDGGDGGGDVQDSDGDGVVDEQDYAPRDADVQERSDLEGADTASGGSDDSAGDGDSADQVSYPSYSGSHSISARQNYWAWEVSLPVEFVLEYRVVNERDENYDFDVLLYPPDRFAEYRAIAEERREGIRPQYLDGSAPGVRSGASNTVRLQAGTYYLVVDNTDLSDAGDWGTEELRRVYIEATTRAP